MSNTEMTALSETPIDSNSISTTITSTSSSSSTSSSTTTTEDTTTTNIESSSTLASSASNNSTSSNENDIEQQQKDTDTGAKTLTEDTTTTTTTTTSNEVQPIVNKIEEEVINNTIASSSPTITPLSRRKRNTQSNNSSNTPPLASDDIEMTDLQNGETDSTTTTTTTTTSTITSPPTAPKAKRTPRLSSQPDKPSKHEVLLTPSEAKELSQKNKRWMYVPIVEPTPIEEMTLPAKRERKQINLPDFVASSQRKSHQPQQHDAKEKTTTPKGKKAAPKTISPKSTTKKGKAATNQHDIVVVVEPMENDVENPNKDIAKLKETINELQDQLRTVSERINHPTTTTTTTNHSNNSITSPKLNSSTNNTNYLQAPVRKSSLYSDDEDDEPVKPVKPTPAPIQKKRKSTTSESNNTTTAIPPATPLSNSSSNPNTPASKSKSVKKQRSSAPNTPLTRGSAYLDTQYEAPAISISSLTNPNSDRAQRSTKGRSRRFGAVGDSSHLTGPLKRCLDILESLMGHQDAYPFLVPVDPVALNILDYFTVIKHPMDFGTIKQSLLTGVYLNIDEFAKDCRLVFANAKEYNPSANPVHAMAVTLEELFEKRFSKVHDMDPMDTDSGNDDKLRKLTQENKNMAKELERIKREKRKAEEEAKYPPMSTDEKILLGDRLRQFFLDNPDKTPSLLKIIEHALPEVEQNEIELDIDKLDNVTLRKLESFVNNTFSPQFQVNQNQREIENVTKQLNRVNKNLRKKNFAKAISKSSVRKLPPTARRDEDLIVDDHEMKEYPPVIIEKDTKTNEQADATSGGSDSSDSEYDSSDSDSSSTFSDSDSDDNNNNNQNNNNLNNNNSNPNNNQNNTPQQQQNNSSNTSSSNNNQPQNNNLNGTTNQPTQNVENITNNNNNNNQNNNLNSTNNLSTSSTTTTTINAPTPQIIQSAAKKTGSLPNQVASWNFANNTATNTGVGQSDSTTSNSSTNTGVGQTNNNNNIHTSSPIPSSTSLNPNISTSTPPIQSETSPSSPSAVSLNSPSSPNRPAATTTNTSTTNPTDSTWNMYKAKNQTLILKEKEKIEYEEQTKREREERELEQKREEERRKTEAIEAQRLAKEKEEKEAEEQRKQIEMERAAAREAREKSAQKSNMSFQYQMDVMASFEENFGSGSMENAPMLKFKPIDDNYDSPAMH